MVKSRPKPRTTRSLKTQRKTQTSFSQVLSSANRRAHEQANRRGGKRALKSVHAAIAATDGDDEFESAAFARRFLRWVVAIAMLPLCWVTTWTLCCRFSQATVYEGFWQTAEFWYFATGALLMIGWFWSGLLQSFFLYLYVLGHELTHAMFVLLYRGKVTAFHVSTEGGYITTNKTNLVIALSPYFVPFWSMVCAVLYAVIRSLAGLSGNWDRAFYAVMGLTWTFHMVWTLWMIPRDQPDLKENGRFLSLVIIYLANLCVLVGLLCVASSTPLADLRDFGLDWLRYAATVGDAAYRWSLDLFAEFRAAGRY